MMLEMILSNASKRRSSILVKDREDSHLEGFPIPCILELPSERFAEAWLVIQMRCEGLL